MEYKYQGIILGKFNVGEADRVYSAYTLEEGKMRLLAKGVRRPNAKLAGNLESVTLSEIFLAKNRGRGNITGAITLENFLRLKENLPAIKKVFEAFKILDSLITQEEKDEKTFRLLLEYLQAMEETAAADNDLVYDILTAGFAIKLLENSGYASDAKNCKDCGEKIRPGENYFSASSGGIVCPNCARKIGKRMSASDETIKFLRLISENKLKNLKKVKADPKTVKNLKIIVSEAIRWAIS